MVWLDTQGMKYFFAIYFIPSPAFCVHAFKGSFETLGPQWNHEHGMALVVCAYVCAYVVGGII